VLTVYNCATKYIKLLKERNSVYIHFIKAFCLTLIGRKCQNKGKQLSVWIFIVLEDKMVHEI